MELLWLWVLLGVVGGILIAVLIFLLNNDLLKITKYKFSGFSESGLKIVHLSDLHGKSFGRKSERLVKKIAKLNPILYVSRAILSIFTVRAIRRLHCRQ